MKNKSIFTILGATIGTSFCCITPVLAVLVGSSSLASSFSGLAPYHNYLVVFTILVLIYAWYDKLKPVNKVECAGLKAEYSYDNSLGTVLKAVDAQ
ncbi:MAG: mercuric ion transport protein [Sulfurimonas sp.]|jgi:mercuric ion transport protein